MEFFYGSKKFFKIPFLKGEKMRNKSMVSFISVVAFLAFVSVASANVTIIKNGEKSVCENASWIVYNLSEEKETTLEFDAGPQGAAYSKVFTVAIAPSGYETNAITMKTAFTNKGPGDLSVNCQRQRFDRHDWKIDAGAGKTYQNDYHLDHTTPQTYIEPGYGMPEGTERGIGAVMGHRPEGAR